MQVDCRQCPPDESSRNQQYNASVPSAVLPQRLYSPQNAPADAPHNNLRVYIDSEQLTENSVNSSHLLLSHKQYPIPLPAHPPPFDCHIYRLLPRYDGTMAYEVYNYDVKNLTIWWKCVKKHLATEKRQNPRNQASNFL